ncbi:hypothetical protein JCM11641_005448 [Rhodosporidiobolus odoratus]
MARHRNPGSTFTLNGATAVTFPISTARSSPPPSGASVGPRARRPAAVEGSPELEIWLDSPPSSSSPTSQQPTFSFPTVSSNSPAALPPKELPPTPTKGSFYKNSSSIAKARQNRQQPAKVNWRDKGQDFAKLRKKALSDQESLSVQQIAAGAGALAFVVMVVIIFASGRSKSPIVKHMERREQILAASLAPSITVGAPPPPVRAHESFRDELSTDSRYLISPTHGDLAEQVMNLYHLAHLSSVLHRIPIAHPLIMPSSEDPAIPTSVPVSTLFDMNRFSAHAKMTFLDWNDLRPHEAAEEGKTEALGCWTGNLQKKETAERARKMQESGLSPSFVPVRAALTKGAAGQGDELKATHDFIARFDLDESAQAGLIDQARHDSSISSSTRRHKNPEQHVMCIDHSLYRPEHPTTRHSTTHLDPRDHTAFFTHGKHLHFAPDLAETAFEVASHLLGHRNPYIAVHISSQARQSECKLLDRGDLCGVDLADYAHAVDRVRHLVASSVHRKSREQRHSARTLNVLVSTDIKDLGFLGELSNLGWTVLEYEDLELRERFGTYQSEILDQVIESRASGFVGTRGSPQSTLSALRVRTWRNGPTELV